MSITTNDYTAARLAARKAAVEAFDGTLQDIHARLETATEQLEELTGHGDGWHPAYDEHTNTDDAYEYLRGAHLQVQALLLFHRHVTAELPQAGADEDLLAERNALAAAVADAVERLRDIPRSQLPERASTALYELERASAKAGAR